MKILGILVLVLFGRPAAGQPSSEKEAVKVIREIFENYIKKKESPDSQTNKVKIEKAIKVLQQQNKVDDLELLINVWMFYSPTDFPTRDLLRPIFQKLREASIKAIEKRLSQPKEWETTETLADLKNLLNELSQVK